MTAQQLHRADARGPGSPDPADKCDTPWRVGVPEEDVTGAGAKAFATLQAKLALRGFALTELAGGSYLVSRWDRTAHLNDLRSVREFLHRVGAVE